MKKRIVCLLLAMVLALSAVSVVSAVELHGMNDIVGHWAENDIAWVLDLGLFLDRDLCQDWDSLVRALR